MWVHRPGPGYGIRLKAKLENQLSALCERDDDMGLVAALVSRQTNSDKVQGGSCGLERHQKYVLTYQTLGRKRRTVRDWRRTEVQKGLSQAQPQ